ncbi:helix-turn-helix domain-containing protein [Nocardia sp. A7]|uniref:helix-turn-helix domain-containing protein n=1 Tax=Nocardia sp. A7 TaxID=2789274 RepID=UPI00397C4BBA
MISENLTDVEQRVLDVLVPGGLLTADTIARNLNMSRWRVARALNSLRRNGDAFRNRHAQWRVTVRQCPLERQSSR